MDRQVADHNWSGEEFVMWIFSGHDNAGQTESGFHIKKVREAAPQFKRIYTAKLNDRASIKLTVRTFMNSRMWSGKLTQPNGRWVLFDPKAVADKILDQILLPLVKDRCREAFSLDREFLNSHPREYVDEHGAIWRRCPLARP
jgi:hypothetical protein